MRLLLFSTLVVACFAKPGLHKIYQGDIDKFIKTLTNVDDPNVLEKLDGQNDRLPGTANLRDFEILHRLYEEYHNKQGENFLTKLFVDIVESSIKHMDYSAYVEGIERQWSIIVDAEHDKFKAIDDRIEQNFYPAIYREVTKKAPEFVKVYDYVYFIFKYLDGTNTEIKQQMKALIRANETDLERKFALIMCRDACGGTDMPGTNCEPAAACAAEIVNDIESPPTCIGKAIAEVNIPNGVNGLVYIRFPSVAKFGGAIDYAYHIYVVVWDYLIKQYKEVERSNDYQDKYQIEGYQQFIHYVFPEIVAQSFERSTYETTDFIKNINEYLSLNCTKENKSDPEFDRCLGARIAYGDLQNKWPRVAELAPGFDELRKVLFNGSLDVVTILDNPTAAAEILKNLEEESKVHRLRVVWDEIELLRTLNKTYTTEMGRCHLHSHIREFSLIINGVDMAIVDNQIREDLKTCKISIVCPTKPDPTSATPSSSPTWPPTTSSSSTWTPSTSSSSTWTPSTSSSSTWTPSTSSSSTWTPSTSSSSIPPSRTSSSSTQPPTTSSSSISPPESTTPPRLTTTSGPSTTTTTVPPTTRGPLCEYLSTEHILDILNDKFLTIHEKQQFAKDYFDSDFVPQYLAFEHLLFLQDVYDNGLLDHEDIVYLFEYHSRLYDVLKTPCSSYDTCEVDRDDCLTVKDLETFGGANFTTPLEKLIEFEEITRDRRHQEAILPQKIYEIAGRAAVPVLKRTENIIDLIESNNPDAFQPKTEVYALFIVLAKNYASEVREKFGEKLANTFEKHWEIIIAGTDRRGVQRFDIERFIEETVFIAELYEIEIYRRIILYYVDDHLVKHGLDEQVLAHLIGDVGKLNLPQLKNLYSVLLKMFPACPTGPEPPVPSNNSTTTPEPTTWTPSAPVPRTPEQCPKCECPSILEGILGPNQRLPSKLIYERAIVSYPSAYGSSEDEDESFKPKRRFRKSLLIKKTTKNDILEIFSQKKRRSSYTRSLDTLYNEIQAVNKLNA